METIFSILIGLVVGHFLAQQTGSRSDWGNMFAFVRLYLHPQGFMFQSVTDQNTASEAAAFMYECVWMLKYSAKCF